ncbi:NUDIX domain-containing protein [Halostella salina]|uniref:NUDIX domain-containing protein n=1 Tax=Halostella salina TaxID=1547897 RepID=UPI000EF78AB2|nr:NUDIX domain-containing protein [Halostella salina]
MSDDPIPHEDWRTIVANVPLVSVDLVVEHDGGVLLGRRTNEPAKGEWFLPGGTVHKNERRREAVHRVAEAELGESVTIQDQLGTVEHFYDTSEFDDVDSKHYLSTAYHCRPVADEPAFELDDQHGALRVVEPPYDDLHEYVRTALELA